MPLFVTALYDREEEAERAIQALHQAGFSTSNIQHVDAKKEQQGFFERLFLNGNGQGTSKSRREEEDLSVMGIHREDVEFYAPLVRQGYSLVIVLCEDDEVEAARNVLESYNVVRPDEILLTEYRGDKTPGGEEAQALTTPSGEPTGRWFDVVEVRKEEWSQRKGAKAHAVHVSPKRHVHHVDINALPGSDISPVFRQMEPAFRQHFGENFAGEGYAYEDVRLAYRFGVRLAENQNLRHHQWSGIEDHARHSWRTQGGGPWASYGKAVRFGWKAVRGDEEREQPRG